MTARSFEDRRAWSATELGHLEHGLRIGVSIEVIAEFLTRDLDDVRQKGQELGLPRRKQLAEEAFD